MSKGAKTTKGR